MQSPKVQTQQTTEEIENQRRKEKVKFMSLEDKLSQLMKALRGVDPQTLAAASVSPSVAPAALAPNTSAPATMKVETDETKEIEAKKSTCESTTVAEPVEEQQRSSGDEAARTEVMKSSSPPAAARDSVADGGVELLMRQYVSTLRTELTDGGDTDDDAGKKTSETARLVKDTKKKQASGDDAAADTPDYSKMSMAELLEQIDEMVDKTTAAPRECEKEENTE